MNQMQRQQRKVIARNKLMRTAGAPLLLVGVLLGMALAGVAIWGDLEANRFDENLSHFRDASLKTLRCPVLMTKGKSGTVTAAFDNPLDRSLTLTVRTHVSRYLTYLRDDTQLLPLAPGETKRLEWTVTPDDIVYGHLILVKVLQLRQYPLPGRLASCGIVVLNFPYLTGKALFGLALAASLLSIGGGLGLWWAGSQPFTKQRRQTTRTLGALAVAVILDMIPSFAGWWMAGALIFAVNVLLMGAMLEHFVNRPADNTLP
jgi:hypothetical protein